VPENRNLRVESRIRKSVIVPRVQGPGRSNRLIFQNTDSGNLPRFFIASWIVKIMKYLVAMPEIIFPFCLKKEKISGTPGNCRIVLGFVEEFSYIEEKISMDSCSVLVL